MMAQIAALLAVEGEQVVLASGPDGDVIVDLVPGGSEAEGWELHWESNCPEWVCLERIWEHFQRQQHFHVVAVHRAFAGAVAKGREGGDSHFLDFLVRIEQKLDSLILAAPRPTMSQEFLAVKDAARFTGLSSSHVRRAIYSGILPAANQGSSARPIWRIARKDLLDWMERKKGGAARLPPKPELKELIKRQLPGFLG